jgi:hypothetical protein
VIHDFSPMATPVYGLMAAHPTDVFGLLNSKFKFQSILGTYTRTSDSQQFRAFSLEDNRSSLTFSSIQGLDVVVANKRSSEVVEFESGERRRYELITIHAAQFGANGVAPLITEVKRAGYSYVTFETISESEYASAVGGTGSYAGANGYFTLTLRAGAGGQTAVPGQPNRSTAEIGSDAQGAIDAYGAAGEQSDGGYEFTGGFADRTTGQAGASVSGSNVFYTQEMVNDQTWRRLGFDSAQQVANDAAYWTEPAPAPTAGVGLFGGSYMPSGVTSMFDFDFNVSSYSDAVTTGDLQYTAAEGTFDFSECLAGDLALVRFDFNVLPQIANTTLEVALIWQTRLADGTPTFTFALTGDPQFYGTGTVGRTFLARPLLSAYFASQEDVNARALLAIRADNPIQIQPLTTLTTIQR